MRRRWKILSGVGLGVIVVVVSAPLLLRHVLRAQLAAAGWPNATIERVRLHGNGMAISGLDLLGNGQATARKVTVDWWLSKVAIDGLAITLANADWSPLLPQGLSETPATAPQSLPLAQLTLNNAQVTIGTRKVEVDATVVRLQAQRLQLSAHVTGDMQSAIDVDGNASLNGDCDMHVVMDRVALELLPSTWVHGIATGRVSGDARVTRTEDVLGIDGDVSIDQPGYVLPLLGQVRAQRLGGHIRWNSAAPLGFAGKLHIDDARASLLGVNVAIPTATVHGDDQRLDVIGHLQALGADLQIDGHMSADWSTAAGTVHVDGIDLNAVAGVLQPWLHLAFSARGQASIAASVSKLADTWHTTGTVTCDHVRLATIDETTRLTLPSAVTEISAAWIDRQLTGTAVLHLQHSQIEAPGVHVASVDGTLPWSLGTDPQLDGSLQFTGVEIAGFPLKQLAAHVRGVDQRIGGAARVAVLDTGHGQVDGWYDLRQQGGTFAVVVPRFTILDPAAVRTAVPEIGQRELTGDVDLSGTVVVTSERIIPNLHFSLAEGTFRDPQAKLTIEGLAAATSITGFTPFSTAGTKQVAFRSAVIGSLAFGDGSARVTAHLPAGIDISDASIAWCGGRLAIPELAVDMAHGRASGVIALARIELGELLRLTIPRQVTGEGLISGTLPLTLEWPEYTFSFGRGSLQADPPNGWLHLKDRSALMSAITTGFAVVDTQIVDTVADLLFDALRIDFIPETPLTSVARVHLSGHGRNGESPLAIGSLDINLRGLERALADALFMQRWQNQPSGSTTNNQSP